MRSLYLALAMLITLTVGSRTATAHCGPCCDSCCGPSCCCHPVLAGGARLVRGALRLATAPVRWLAHHHCCHGCCGGCCYDSCCDSGCGYGPYAGYDAGQALPAGAEQAAPAVEAAVYTPVVSPENLESLTADQRLAAAQQAIAQGINLYRRGELEVAREYFNEATELTPEMAAAWGLRGVAASAAQETEVAAECANRVREITLENAAERSKLYRTLAPIQGNSRASFEQLVRSNDVRQPVEQIVRLP